MFANKHVLNMCSFCSIIISSKARDVLFCHMVRVQSPTKNLNFNFYPQFECVWRIKTTTKCSNAHHTLTNYQVNKLTIFLPSFFLFHFNATFYPVFHLFLMYCSFFIVSNLNNAFLQQICIYLFAKRFLIVSICWTILPKC